MPSKVCNCCGLLKDFSEFRKDTRLKSGVGCTCKSCCVVRAKAWQLKNMERYKAYNKHWRETNKDYDNKRKLAWVKNNPEKKKLSDSKAYYKHRDKKLEQGRKYRQANYDKVKERNKRWLKNNIYVKLQHNAKRRAAKINRTPAWLTSDDLWLISEFYHLAKLRSAQTGFAWHVDHIIPLLGETVSGLHVPQNLQVIPAVVNLMKYNKFAPDAN